MIIPPECESKTNNRKIPISHKRSKITFQYNSSDEIRKIDLECVFEGKPVKRCDWLLIMPNGYEIFVELKGCDTEEGIKQVEASIKKCSKDPKKHGKTSFVISTHCPLSSTEIQKFQRQFMKKYRSELIVRNSPHTYKLV